MTWSDFIIRYQPFEETQNSSWKMTRVSSVFLASFTFCIPCAWCEWYRRTVTQSLRYKVIHVHESPAAILCRNEYTLIGTIRFAQWLYLFDTLVSVINIIGTKFHLKLHSICKHPFISVIWSFILINERQLYQKPSRENKYVRYRTIKPRC